jgi:inhibitor of cysteine peptidase
MKRWIRALVVATLGALVVGVVGCTQPASGPARLSDGDSGKTVELAVGGSLVVDLEENVTTGYAWALQGSVPGALEAAGDEQKAAADTGAVGAAGRHIFTYKAAKAGEGKLTLVYARPWESVQPAKTFTVDVVVK